MTRRLAKRLGHYHISGMSGKDWKSLLPKIARMAIADAFGAGGLTEEKIAALVSEYPELAEKRATFVTLHKHGRLRGCIGSILPVRPLIEDVIHNARAAAFEDSRFPPLQPEELDEIDIEISLLTVPQPLSYEDEADLRRKIRPGVDGVIIRLDGRQATFLPSVWEQLPDFDRFFAHLCLKAGLPADCLRLHPEVHVYQAEKIVEH